MQRLLLVILSLSVALAGCANNADNPLDGDNGLPGTDSSAAPPMADDAARDLLERAVGATPDRYGFTMTATRDGAHLLSARGTFDNATGRSWLAVEGAPAAFAPLRLPEGGLSIYTSEGGALYRLGDVAVAQAAQIEQLQGIVPAQLMTPQSVLAARDANLTVTGVQLVSHEGQPALRVAFRIAEAEGNVEGAATLLQDPPRLVALDATLPEDERAGALSGAAIAAKIQYEDEAAAFPEDAPRLLSLGYNMRTTSSSGSQSWTFQHAGSVPLADVVAIVQDPGQAKGKTLAETPVAFQMRLDEGTATAQGITLTFTDTDGDGLVTKGDTLVITAGEDAAFRPQVVLHDGATTTYVTSDLFLVFRTVFGGF